MLSRVKKQPKSAVRKRNDQHRCEGKDSEISVEEAAGGASRLPGKVREIGRLVVGSWGIQMSLTIFFSEDVTKWRCVGA